MESLFHLGLHWMPKYPFRVSSIQRIKMPENLLKNLPSVLVETRNGDKNFTVKQKDGRKNVCVQAVDEWVIVSVLFGVDTLKTGFLAKGPKLSMLKYLLLEGSFL